MGRTRIFIILGLLVAAVVSRLIPHPSNWTAVGALAIWSGYLFRDRFSVILAPLVVLLVTDLILRTHVTMPWTFGAYALIALLSRELNLQKNGGRLLGASLMTSVLFFTISNFGVWASTGFYSHTWEGLVTCFTMALPFLSAQVVGDLVYTAVFTGVIYATQMAAATPVPVRNR